MESNIYPVITLYQPWATWIMRGWKTIETRTHARFSCLMYKKFLIHAGQKTDDSDLTLKNPFLTKEQILFNPDEIINGAILGFVYCDAAGWLCGDTYENKSALIECQDKFGLFLTDANKLTEPIYERGEMGIWYYDIENKCKIKKREITKKQQLFL